MEKNCFICGVETESDFLHPPLCQRHHDFSVLLAVTRRTGYEVTAHNLAINYERLRITPCFPAKDIPVLLQEMSPEQKEFEFGSEVE